MLKVLKVPIEKTWYPLIPIVLQRRIDLMETLLFDVIQKHGNTINK